MERASTGLGPGGRPRNISDRIFLGEREGELLVRRRGTDEGLDPREVEDLGLADLALRASITVVSPQEAWIMGHVARSNRELEAAAEGWGLEHGINSANLPTVGVRNVGLRTRQQIKLMTSERPGDGLGFGLLPVLEEISAGMATVDRDELEKELCLFLRDTWVGTNVRDWAAAMEAGAAPALRVADILWPEYQGPTGLAAANETLSERGEDSEESEEEEEEEDGFDNLMREARQGTTGTEREEERRERARPRERPREERRERRPNSNGADIMAAAIGEVGKLMAQQAERQQARIEELTQKRTEAIKEKNESGKKRKSGEDWKSEDKEVYVVYVGEEKVATEDDAHEKFAWEVRAKLLTPNGKPEDWWTKETPVKTGPRLGANLYMDHMMAGRINETTACKIYDRTSGPVSSVSSGPEGDHRALGR